MKNITNYIFENSNELLVSISKCKFDVTSCNNMPISTKTERTQKAKAQEKIVINILKETLTDYDIYSCEEWCKNNSLNYSPKTDSYYGDIMVCKNNKTLYNIDLKVGSKTYLGTPDALSLSNFGKTSIKNIGKFIYLCINETGNNVAIISAPKLFNIQKSGKFVVSKDRSTILSNNVFSNAKICDNKNASNHDLNTLYEEDFVLTQTIENNKDI